MVGVSQRQLIHQQGWRNNRANALDAEVVGGMGLAHGDQGQNGRAVCRTMKKAQEVLEARHAAALGRQADARTNAGEPMKARALRGGQPCNAGGRTVEAMKGGLSVASEAVVLHGF